MRYDSEYKKMDGIIERSMRLFKKPGVLTVRPGVKMIGGVFVDKPSIVVTVDKKRKHVNVKNKLPMVVGDYLIDVREGTPMEKLRAHDPETYHLLNKMGPDNVKDPEHSFLRTVSDGKLMQPATRPVKIAATEASHKDKPVYEGPDGHPLNVVEATMTITANASPDGGYAAVSEFLKKTQKKLTVAMYSFTSKDLMNDTVAAVKPNVDFKMILDGPPNGTKNPQQPDSVTVANILKADPGNAKVNWALENGNASRGHINPMSGIFPSAYHIKVAVRDSNTFWLSSGNFNLSNQPNITPSQQSGPYDRDWHVIIENADLAQLFEAYILNDFKVAGLQQASPATAAAELAAKRMRDKEKAAMGKVISLEKKRSGGSKQNNFPQPTSTLGIAQEFKNVSASIQPVLTPDRGNNGTQYVDQILKLIDSAERTLFMQFQYIAAYGTDMRTGKNKQPVFMLLLEAVRNALMRNVAVQIIVSQFESKWLEPVFEFDKAVYATMKTMVGVHNKGIVVDGQKVLVSSQNWSAEGVLENRDAGVIITNPQIANYFEQIFIEDWMFRTKREPVAPNAPKSLFEK